MLHADSGKAASSGADNVKSLMRVLDQDDVVDGKSKAHFVN